jgi:hypothetical protein
MSSAASMDTPVAGGQSQQAEETLKRWLKRKREARDDRRAYEKQWMINQHFAAGIQWLKWSQRDHRVLEVQKDEHGRRLDTVDVLSQYRSTAIGKIANGGDLRSELLANYGNDVTADMYAEQLNGAVRYAWEEECRGDRKALAVLRALVELGTAAIRCRYDRSKGSVIAREVPHRDGRPILDENEQRSYVSERQMLGESANLRQLREGKICWEKLSAWNLLPPPGVEDPEDFPWELIVRPVPLDELKRLYGAKANGVKADKIEDMGMLAYSRPRLGDGPSQTPAVAQNLERHALVYTGYDRVDEETVVFTNDGHLLDSDKNLPYQLPPWGPRSGITYFRWDILDGRFWGRAFLEPGIGPQKLRNKRLSQIDEIIDRGLPKVYGEEGSLVRRPQGRPMEYVELVRGTPAPTIFAGVPVGAWMTTDVELQDQNIEKALGLRDIALGQSPAGVSAYSAMALMVEQDALKLDPIAQEFRLAIADVTRDTVEAMRQWPSDKQLLIAGDDNELDVQSFNARQAIPPAYLVRPAKGGVLPRSQAAEVQKIADLFNAAVTSGAVAQNPDAWMDWYKSSLDQGTAQDLPDQGSNQQLHKAALENVVIQQGQVPPVADYDDPNVHIPEHRQAEAQTQMALDEAMISGDQQRAAILQQTIGRFQAHIQQHVQQQQMNQAGVQAPALNMPGANGQPAAAVNGPQQAQPDQPYFNSRAVRFENQILAPMPPRLRG